MKLHKFLFVNLIYGLALKEIEGKLSYMYSFVIIPNGIIKYNQLMDKFNLKNENKSSLKCFKEPSSGVKGTIICGTHSETILLINQKYFNNESITLPVIEYSRYLGSQSTIIHLIPEMILNANNIDGNYISIFSKPLYSNMFLEEHFSNLSADLISQREVYFKIFSELCEELSNNNSIIVNRICDPEFVLLFFKKDIQKILFFFLELRLHLSAKESVTADMILYFLREQVTNNIIYDLDSDWKNHFENISYNLNESKENILLCFLITDLLNLINLIRNFDKLSTIYEINHNEINLIGKSVIMVELSKNYIEIEWISQFVIRDEYDRTVEYFICKANENSIFFFIDNIKLFENQSRFLKFSLQTSEIFYEKIFEIKIDTL